ncbi:hypothetical protein C9374_004073 [Naegleria lovaniensis]|uniref:Uncharacterized protein n=1 Tax=Naegleria lovaniensis TaxID=51637 RepID=A0AA88KJM8_NAELO|nr:uncharacterized protein C9374_004073 [Naegleria lovaniensis]KAG2383402.1 hypothetical protein C9374_004073 [Naegleria lovaniensis]
MTDVKPFSNPVNEEQDASKSEDKNDINDDEDDDKMATQKTAVDPTLPETANTSQDKKTSGMSDNSNEPSNNVSASPTLDNNASDQGAKILIMDKQVSPNEALYNQEYQLEKVIGCMFTTLEKIENQATRAWFIAETAFIMEKSTKYAEAFGIYVKAGIILHQAIETMKNLEVESERSKALRSFLTTVLRDIFERTLAIQQDKLNSSINSSQSPQNEVGVHQILYMYAIRIAQEAAYKEYLNSSQCTKECLAMYIRAKYIFEYLIEASEEYSEKVELRNFLAKFTERINFLEN